MTPGWIMAAACVVALAGAADDDAPEIKLADCPAAVRKTLLDHAKGSKIETVSKEVTDDETIYWADLVLDGRPYAIGVLEDGTLAELNLEVDEDEVPIERCPAPVRATFRREAAGAKVESLAKDLRYGVAVYEAVVALGGKSYEVAVAEDGTLVEKTLVIDDEPIELAHCPAAVQKAFREQAEGGKVGEVTRSSGIGHPTYEAEVEVNGKVYLVEVSGSGLLIARSLEAGDD